MGTKTEYVPLHLKYRPRTFGDMVGQEPAVTQLSGMIKSERVSRAILISGIHGSGKTSLARIVARYLNCMDDSSWEPCGKCSSCVKGDNHPDIIEINAANAGKIDDMRDIISGAKYAPNTRYRIFIMDELHQATKQALQAFLKPLEEPKKRTIFILVTTNPEKLPDTILGRCQHVKLYSIKPQQTVKLLQRVSKAEGYDFDTQVYLDIANLVRGIPRNALQALDAVINYVNAKGGVDKLGGDQIKLLPDIIGSVVSVPPKKAVSVCLSSIYRGKYNKALKAVQLVEDREFLIRTLLDWHIKAMYLSVSKKLVTDDDMKYYAPLFEQIEKDEIELDAYLMSKITEVMIETTAMMVDYKLEPYHLAVSMVLKCTNIVREAE